MNNKLIILIFLILNYLNINSGCNSCKKCGRKSNQTSKIPNPPKHLTIPSKKSKPKIVNPEVPHKGNINEYKKKTKIQQQNLGEIESIYEKTPDLIDENIDISNVQLSEYKKEDLKFNSFNAEITVKAFNKTIEFIRKLIKKRGLTGNFKVEKVVSENTGKNSLKKLKITSQSGQSFHIFCKRDNTVFQNQTENMLKCFKKINLLPFNYYYDPETSIMITEDVTEKGYKFLDFGIDVTEKNKQIWNKCKNINEFRFWCYILKSDDIDPMYKYDNCCFKDNKVYALDLRYAELFDLDKNASDYSDFFKYLFKSINTNEIPEDHKDSDHYKTWEQSINNFTDFTDEEKEDINEKIVDLLIYVTKLLEQAKNEKDSLDVINIRNYLNNIIDKIYYFFEDYVKKYSVKNGKMVFGQSENFTIYLSLIKMKNEGYSYGNLNYRFNEYIKNDIDFNSILTKETVCKIFDIYCHSINDNIFYSKLSKDTL